MGTKYDPIPLNFQPGFLLTESPLASTGRFTGGFGVRFRRNRAEKRGGFSALTTTPLNGIPRGAYSWNDLTQRELIGVGTASNLYAIPDTTFIPQDITPAGLLPGNVYAASLSGWGTGYWGLGTWGGSQPGQAISSPARVWTIGHFGRIGLFCPGPSGSIYSWDPTGLAGSVATVVPNAPNVASGIVTTSDNILIAYGTNFNPNNPSAPGTVDPLQIWNSAQGDFTNWNTLAVAGPNGAPSSVNRLNVGNQIVGAADLATHVTLFWTDFSLHAAQYTGSQFVFDIYPLGLNCGLIGVLAKVIVNSTAYWMSQQGFFTYSGGVSKLPNQDDIKDFVFKNMTAQAVTNIVAWYDNFYDEVSWAIPINGSLENSIIVIYSIAGQYWYTDTMPIARTSDASLQHVGDVLVPNARPQTPLFFGQDGFLYQDDLGLDANGKDKPWSLSFAPVESGTFGSAQIALVGGQAWIETLGVFLDMERQVGNVTAVLMATDRTQPESAIVDIGFAMADPRTSACDLRVAGRELYLTLMGDGIGCDFRLGVTRLEIGSAGIRR
jgi:hypothetical protein